jgi:aryl-alcohol dehydrogenase-like predicted oxidoreductase
MNVQYSTDDSRNIKEKSINYWKVKNREFSNNYMNKLALGTVQFGLDYGINNSTGQVSEEEVSKIISLAAANGIYFIDTAQGYGQSERVLGKAFRGSGNDFHIISKLSDENLYQVEKSIHYSLELLQTDHLYGFLIHNFDSFVKNPYIYSEILKLRQEGLISKTGFSVYFPEQITYLFEKNIPFDLIQLPYNLFDRRFEKFFPVLKEKNVEIHVRSIFLQGLFFIKPEKLEIHFNPVKDKIIKLHRLANDTNVSLPSLCLNFAAGNKYIEKLVIGVDNSRNLSENIAALEEFEKFLPCQNELNEFVEYNEKIILSFNWPKQ